MVSNITYRFSTFSDYSVLTYNKDDVIRILTDFEGVNLAPAIIQEIMPLGIPNQRMQFMAQNGLLLITISSERIDIQLTSDRKEGFDQKGIDDIKDKMVSYMTKLTDIFSDRVALPYRLAWFTSYVYFDQSKEEKDAYRDRFLKDIEYFKDNRLDDMMARFGTQRKVIISNQEEMINVILTVNRHITDKGTDNEVDGYKADFDINTWQGKRINRFEKDTYEEFIGKAIEEQVKLKEEVMV